MKLKDILKKVGTGIFGDLVPGGDAIMTLVNAMTGAEQLGPASSGVDVEAAIYNLPADRRADLLEREIEFGIAEVKSWTDIQQLLAHADEAGSSTRPFVAKLMAIAVFVAIMLLMVCFVIALFRGSEAMLIALSETWPALLAILGTPAALLRAYFGLRTSEKKSRYAASIGQTVPSVGSTITDLLKKGG